MTQSKKNVKFYWMTLATSQLEAEFEQAPNPYETENPFPIINPQSISSRICHGKNVMDISKGVFACRKRARGSVVQTKVQVRVTLLLSGRKSWKRNLRSEMYEPAFSIPYPIR